WQGKGATLTLVSDITERKTEEEMREKSEEHFRLLDTQMQWGLAVHEVISDDNGRPIDYRYVSINKGFTAMNELRELTGKKLSEVLPNPDEHWIRVIGSVALSGKPVHFDRYSERLGKHFNVYAYSPKKNQCAIIISDVTDKKEAEQAVEYLSFHDQLTG